MDRPQKEFYNCYSQRLAGYLMLNGFVLMGIAPNEKYVNRNVFYFGKSAELDSAVQDYLNQR